MPLWKVYHPAGAYSAQDKKEFVEKVTAMYSRVPIPKFYVVMIFEEVAAESLYVGGIARQIRSSQDRPPGQDLARPHH